MATEDAFHCYRALIRSYVYGTMRFASSRIASLTLQNVVLEYGLQSSESLDGHPYKKVLERIAGLTRRQYETFEYVSEISALVYLTTLLDTFLSDTTKFLLLLNPKSIGKNRAVLLEAVLSAKSPHELVNQAASDKAREVSYLPFAGRVDFLRTQFGLQIVTSDAIMESLGRLAELRNILVHDQAVYTCELDPSGHLVATQKTCAVHPTQIGSADVQEAHSVYKELVGAVIHAVVSQVLKQEAHPEYIKLRKVLGTEDKGAADDEAKGDA